MVGTHRSGVGSPAAQCRAESVFRARRRLTVPLRPPKRRAPADEILRGRCRRRTWRSSSTLSRKPPENPEPFLAMFDENVEWDMSGGPFPIKKVYGPEAVREFFRTWTGTFDDWGFEADEVIDA